MQTDSNRPRTLTITHVEHTLHLSAKIRVARRVNNVDLHVLVSDLWIVSV
jgi:hypothetical protein